GLHALDRLVPPLQASRCPSVASTPRANVGWLENVVSASPGHRYHSQGVPQKIRFAAHLPRCSAVPLRVASSGAENLVRVITYGWISFSPAQAMFCNRRGNEVTR